MPTSKSSIDHRDVYYRKGKSAGYRARSAYKLLHLDEEFDLFTGVETAVDLCAAPGSWSQVLGQKLKPMEGGRRVVSLDLQPMAPLPNITTLQADITLPCTIPLVLDHLGGRKADLVVCDGAPDVTGVHDLDAYLHSQLLLAALTLSLTLLSPGATLIFKIFLSPLDPKAEFLASQLRCFFPGSPPTRDESPVFSEFNVIEDVEEKRQGVDQQGRRGGVWVRKPRSSRGGSAEAFIVCRNFDPSTIPLPAMSSPTVLDKLRNTTGTLTLDSLSTLGLSEGELNIGKEWEVIKAYVEGGDLLAMNNRLKPPSPKLHLPLNSSQAVHHTFSTLFTLQENHSPKALQTQPTPFDEPPEYFSPKVAPHTDTTYLSPEKIKKGRTNSPGQDEGERRQNSIDSLTPNPSPVSLNGPTRPWASRSHHHHYATSTSTKASVSTLTSTTEKLGVHPRLRSSSTASSSSHLALVDEPMTSPALSSSSKTDLFFSGSLDLPAPPRALNNVDLGKGLPSSVNPKKEERCITMPTPVKLRLPPRKEKFRGDSTDSVLSEPSWRGVGAGPGGLGRFGGLTNGLEEISTSRLRSLSNPISPFGGDTQIIPSVPPVYSTLPLIPPLQDQSLGALVTPKHVSALPFSYQNFTDITPKGEPDRKLCRKESQQLEREHRQAEFDTSLHTDDIVEPDVKNRGDDGQQRLRGWKLVKKLGEGAFSAVWSAVSVESLHSGPSRNSRRSNTSRVAALKMMTRHSPVLDSRTRISFLREVEVLRHISHPSIVQYLDSFSTCGHDVLVLEKLEGGELFDLMSVEKNRQRMILPGPENGEGQESDKDGEGFSRRVFGELVKAVGWLHEIGVVHRDIKLENILFTINPFSLPPTSTGSIPLDQLPHVTEPLIKLTDFGLSRFISRESPLLQTRCGSESFAAPEIIMGKLYDGRQTDSWAIGVVLYGLIIGELPFDTFDREEDEQISALSSRTVGLLSEKERVRKKMMRIAKGEYTWPSPVPVHSEEIPGAYAPGTGSPNLRRLVALLLQWDPLQRAKPADLWTHPWMSGPGSVPRPVEHGYDCSCGIDEREVGYVERERRRRRVLDGFLVEEDGIEEVARAEH
ncbi:uncharacterized protein L203_104446 [Cryptococcus depauperatus CBS 7841]|uniref:Uncharacterized protein n=1 Tax=Cryptococcus depauperatus CBS 7841 TaxID=1295531 RepID=A0A1E3II58_9TREE|nr:CAMK protein kinase [Cryptococcus depauperatus CBS 7841]